MKRIQRKALPVFFMFVITIAICLFGGSEAVSAANLRVITVPADPNDSSQPHYTYNGHLTTLKAILRGANPATQYYYRWDINGDGNWDQLQGKTYANVAGGAAGKWYSVYGNDLSGQQYLPDITEERKQINAFIQVTTSINAFGQPDYLNSWFGSYLLLQYRDLSPVDPNGLNDKQRSILKNIAMEDALWYLHKQFVRGEDSGTGATGYMPAGSNDGKAPNTALFVLAMAENGHYGAFPAGSDLFNTSDLNERNDALYNTDPYADDIYRAINYLLINLRELTIYNELDKSDDGVGRIDAGTNYSGLHIPSYTVSELNCNSLTLAALAKSGFTGSTVAASSSLVNGLPFELIVQRMVDAGIAAQIDESSVIDAQGGWTYIPVNNSQVVTAAGVNPLISGGWIYALHTAEKEMGASGVYINKRLKDRLANHLVYTQNTDGGCKFEAMGTDSVFSPVGNYLLACKWLGWDQWDASDTDSAGYPNTSFTKGQARLIYDRYLQYAIDNWEKPFDGTKGYYGGYLWTSGNFNGADFQECFSGTAASNLVAKSLYEIKTFAEYDESPLVSFGPNDWKKQFSVSLIKGQHFSGYYREQNNTLDQNYLDLPGTTAYAAMAGGDLYPAISEVSITTVSLTEATTGLEYSHILTATGGLQEYYSWTISGLPAGLTYDSNTGEISGTPTLAGDYALYVSVTDGISIDLATLSLSVRNGELTITTNSFANSLAGESNSYNLVAIGGVAPYTWQSTSLPLGLSLDAATGVISGIPIETGEFSIEVTVTDSASAVSQKTLLLRINAYKPLRIVTTQLPIAYVSSPYSTMLKAAGGNAAYYSWSESGLPEGLSLNASTGEINGTPLSEGTYPLAITVEDSVGTTTQINLTLTVRRVNITTTELPPVYYAGGTNQPYSFTMSAEGGQEPYTWSCEAYFYIPNDPTDLPGEIVFDTVNGKLQGVVRVGDQPQPCYLIIRATDAAGKYDEKQYFLDVSPYFVHIITQSMPNGFTDQEYTVQLKAENVDNNTTFVWSAEYLPTGLIIDANTGTISGTIAEAGEYRIKVKVHLPGDSSMYIQRYFSFYILEPLSIDTSSLPSGTVNTGYSYALQSHGGMLPYPYRDECTWTASGLPSGLNINESSGIIYGVPSEDGIFTVTIGLLDSEGNSASKQLDLIIDDAIGTDACFIATAAYGSIYQQPVVLLRQFRDQFLLTNSWGRSFVEFYYHNSPPIAQFIADSEFLKLLTRAALSPVILAVFIIFHPVWGLILLSLLIGMVYMWRIRQKNVFIN
jgi:hypothetical protein